jgi:pyrimidine-nucleoside phosphorylase
VEVAQAVQVLTGDHRAKDYVEVLLGLGGWMVFLAGKARTPDEGSELLSDKIAHGAALERFKQMIAKQGGDPRVVEDPYHHLPRARHALAVRSKSEGIVQKLDARKVGIAARHLGAGRMKAEDPVDLSAGILLGKKVGDKVAKDEMLATLYASDREKLERAQAEYLEAVVIGPRPVSKKPVIRKIIR